MLDARQIRPAAVAGSFYAAEPTRLARDVDALLARAEGPSVQAKAFVVPHAGYVYSGPIAATAYAALRARRPAPTKVVLLGPAHTVGFRGLALPGVGAFETPLGVVPIDEALAARLAALPQVVVSAQAHRTEHSLEVQLPFLQRALGDFTLLPLVVGDASPEDVAQVLDECWGGPETVVLVSTDLSHYLPAEQARRVDGRTARQVLALEYEALEGPQACGHAPLRGLLLAARRRHLKAQLLDLRNSGDTEGDADRVVGYGAFGFAPAPPEDGRGAVLLGLARQALEVAFGAPKQPASPQPWLDELRAVFVTLTKHGELRGCVGQLEARLPLRQAVESAARSAAFEDDRFPPLREDELGEVSIEVSVLTPLEQLDVHSEAELLAAMRPGVDGLLLKVGARQGVFIPEMWNQLPTPQAFLAALRRKARLPAEGWPAGLTVFRFTAQAYEEHRA